MNACRLEVVAKAIACQPGKQKPLPRKRGHSYLGTLRPAPFYWNVAPHTNSADEKRSTVVDDKVLCPVTAEKHLQLLLGNEIVLQRTPHADNLDGRMMPV
jgi:hypothetical protein